MLLLFNRKFLHFSLISFCSRVRVHDPPDVTIVYSLAIYFCKWGLFQMPTVADNVESNVELRAAPAFLQLFRHHPLHHDRVLPRIERRLCDHEAAISIHHGNFTGDQCNLMSIPRQ
jgi:hypothetical protein